MCFDMALEFGFAQKNSGHTRLYVCLCAYSNTIINIIIIYLSTSYEYNFMQWHLTSMFALANTVPFVVENSIWGHLMQSCRECRTPFASTRCTHILWNDQLYYGLWIYRKREIIDTVILQRQRWRWPTTDIHRTVVEKCREKKIQLFIHTYKIQESRLELNLNDPNLRNGFALICLC